MYELYCLYLYRILFNLLSSFSWAIAADGPVPACDTTGSWEASPLQDWRAKFATLNHPVPPVPWPQVIVWGGQQSWHPSCSDSPPRPMAPGPKPPAPSPWHSCLSPGPRGHTAVCWGKRTPPPQYQLFDNQNILSMEVFLLMELCVPYGMFSLWA